MVLAYPLEAVGTDIAASDDRCRRPLRVRGLTGLRLLDVTSPPAATCHPGPAFGIAGTRRLAGLAPAR